VPLASTLHGSSELRARLRKALGVSEAVDISLGPRQCLYKRPRRGLGGHIMFTIDHVYGLLYVSTHLFRASK
jgi:hypothetical protein